VRNKTGQAEKGANRREGSQTLRAERSGQAKPAASGPFRPVCAVGKQSPREESHPALEATRFGSLNSRRRRNSTGGQVEFGQTISA